MKPSLLTIPKPVTLIIAVAFHAEAKPLIASLALKHHRHAGHINVYANAAQTIILVITGMGKINMALGLGLIMANLNQDGLTCLCNIGIAGADTLSIGCVAKADKIIDQSSDKTHYPALLGNESIPLSPLHTVDTAAMTYPDKAMVDMEGAAFFQCASQMAPISLIMVLKVISDNPTHSPDTLTAKAVTELISAQQPQLIIQLKHLVDKAASVIDTTFDQTIFDAITAKAHFSTYQQLTLKKYLRHWPSAPDKSPLSVIDIHQDAKGILTALHDLIQHPE